MSLTVRRERRHDFTVITIVGEVDRNGMSQLGKHIDEAFEQHPGPRLLFDLSEMSFIDSSGLRLLIGACGRTARNGGTCAVCGLCPTPRKILQITGLDAMFDIYADVTAALAGGPLESAATRHLV
ncbi:STAS domain-containing protein [Sphaerisporangium sp. TRM90804]|uniref:STAS domain-containing protein n=1 Tax=Sphaerisporangium sp. TRM90804 TaxID=3031113 RepID=UPI0024491DF2|nr:STAS domain-containing protein [Sphaerisporangium sp. TRM90804]MDH2427160.1 STAS domain-containing protein [Sphaerisporangium sp. TRM90804]